MRRLLPILLSLLFLLSSPALAEGAELLVNGSVDEVSAAGYPTGWVQDMWFTEAGVSLLSVEGGGVEGSCLRVENVSVNDARWAQVVEVEPDTLYRFSAMVRAEGVGAGGYGANLSIGGVKATAETALAKKWPLSRDLYLFTNGKPAGNTAKFMDFMLDPKLGQQDVLKAGYIPLAK